VFFFFLSNQASTSTVPKKNFPSEKTRKHDDARPIHNNEWYNWTCPICHEEVPIKGWNGGKYYRAKHLKTAHNLKPHQAPLPGQQNNTQRALMRAKQAQEQGHDHTMIHIQNSGLKEIFPKQTTWLCTTCLSRGTTAKVTAYNCDPSTRSINRARWWANLSPAQKQTLATAVRWTDDQLKEKDAFFAETVKQSKPHKPTNTKHYNQRLKELRSSWRKQHGRSTDARKATGAANANTTFVAVPKRSLHILRARAANPNQDMTQEKKQGLKRHWQDLTEQGIEPNPGPRFHSNTNLNIWQINIRSFHQRGWDVLNLAKKENIQVVLLQETFLTKDQGNSIARSSKDWHFFHYPSLATQNSPHGRRPTGGVAIAVHKNINCSQATGYHNQAGEWLRIAVGPIYITSAYRQPNATAQHKEAWNKTLSEDLASIGATTCFCGGDSTMTPSQMT